MPKILITGNGFDLSLGLPTKYSDFMSVLELVETKSYIDFETVYKECSTYSYIKEHYTPFDFDEKKIESFREKVQENVWIDFFKEQQEIDTWIDFENEIEFILEGVFGGIEEIESLVDSITGLFRIHNVLDSKKAISILEKLKIIKRKPYNEIPITINKGYLIKKYGIETGINKDKISRILIEDLDKFKEVFNDYFEIFIFPFYKHRKTPIDKNIFSSIDKHFTFNYTPSFEKIYNTSCKTSFLHGEIGMPEKMVLGISELPDCDFDKKAFIPFTKSFQKLANDTDYKFITDYEKEEESNYYFFFLGHSLDTSDKGYIDEVFNFLNSLKTSNNKIVVIYHNQEAKLSLLANLFTIRGGREIESMMRNKKLEFNHINSKEFQDNLRIDISIPPQDLKGYFF